ncbi:MAG TPA: ATP-binding protein [Kofleriaceae bacterium]|nr:ATP-binding protein [Kofleriaceae bacterium]
MGDLVGHLGAVDKASIFDAFERAATRVGLAMFVVHVNASPPTLLYCSHLLADLVGRPMNELVGRPPWVLVAPGQQDRVRDIIASRGPGAVPLTLEFEIERPDGTRRPIEVGVARISTTKAELAVCYFRDMTGEHEAITALRQSEERFRSLIEKAPDGVVIVQQGRVVLANARAVRMFGETDYTAVHGKPLANWLLPEEAARAMERIGQLFQGAAVKSSEYQLKNGFIAEVHSVVCEYDGQSSILAFVRDTTERRQMQDQLFRADRLAALGTMAATVAHEINNPLTYLQLNLQLLQRIADAEPDPARAAVLHEHLADALQGVERVAKIVRDLRAHSRDGKDEPETAVDLVAVVEQALQIVGHDLRHRAELVLRFPEEPAIVRGNASRLEQVVINLVVNAVQALEGNANTITIEINVGTEVRLTVTDTGPGLPDPERVFEPFFTTKPIGEGTGLGLSVCKQLVERMGGRIEVLSTSTQGTSIAITLPRRMRPTPPALPPTAPPPTSRMRILIVDDEPQVLSAIQGLLSSDHDVQTANDGQAALATIADGNYDVILCDLMMPHMNGRDIYDQIRVRWPGLERRIVFVTGGAFVPALSAFLETVDNLKLRKPFTVEHVLALVQEAKRRIQGVSATH